MAKINKRKSPKILGGEKKKRERFIDLDRYFHDDKMYNAVIYGNPRSGKSVLMANFVNMYQGMGYTCFINDVAKGFSVKTGKPRSEILMFFSEDLEWIKGVRIFVPEGCKVQIPTQKFEQVTVTSYDEIFTNLKKDKVNVICIESFILNPVALSRFWALFAIELLIRAKQYDLKLPVFGCLDQINNIFPSIGHGFSGPASKAQNSSSNYFARFLRDSSGCGVKMAATSHQISAVKKNVRLSFQWKFFKNLSEDVGAAVPRIRPAQHKIQTLPIDQAYGCDDQSWGDIIPDIPNVTYDPDPVYYKGKFIKDLLWTLESEYLEQVEFSTERYIQTRLARGLRRTQIGYMYLLGHTYKHIAEVCKITKGSVEKALHRCCEDPYFCELMREYRPNYKFPIGEPS